MTCPMSKSAPLTESQIRKFCEGGCSIDCDKLLKEYIERLKRRKKNESV